MVAYGVQPRLLMRDPLEHNAVLAINPEAKESRILPVQLVNPESPVVASSSEQLNPLERRFL